MNARHLIATAVVLVWAACGSAVGWADPAPERGQEGVAAGDRASGAGRGGPGSDAGALGEAATERIGVRWRFPADRAVVYRMTRVSQDRTPLPGKDAVYTREIERTVRHVAGEPADGATPVTITWEGMRFDNTDDYGERTFFDSSLRHHWVKTREPGIGALACTLGQSLTLRLTPGGRIVGFEGHEDLLRGMERNLTSWGLAGENTYPMLQSLYSPVTLKETTEPLYSFVPGAEIGVGESYEVVRPLVLPKVGVVKSIETHTLEGVETDGEGRTLARFAVSGRVEWPEPAAEIRERFFVAIDHNHVEGSWTYDVGRGLPVAYEVEAYFNADVVNYDPETKVTTEITTVQTTTDTLTLVPNADKAPAAEAGEPAAD